MKVPISKRLQLCTALVPEGARVADVGADHGYLGIALLLSGRATHVVASDLREKPLSKARQNAAQFGVADRMTFLLCDGLEEVQPEQVDTIVCAGMGGDTIAYILSRCEWVKESRPRLILQPQTSGNDLRRFLGENGFSIRQEQLVEDGGFLYFAMEAVYGGGVPLTPGQQYVSPQLLASGSPLLPKYLCRVEESLVKTVAGISRASYSELDRLRYYETALREVREMREHANC